MGYVRGQALAATALGVVFLLGAGIAAYRHFGAAPEIVIQDTPGTTSDKPQSDPVPENKPAGKVVVHVVGAVSSPGVYRLPAGSRAEDAIKAAGGALPGAALDSINLAAPIEDGTQLRVLLADEPPPLQSQTPTRAPQDTSAGKTEGRITKLREPSQGTVNVNTASEEELQRLPGVGPATARRIIEYRTQNGPFSSPEQLLDISGIGPKKLAAMLPFVRVR